MIRNLLYSLLLHGLFLLIILGSFSTAEFDENKTNEVAVSLISISGVQDSSIIRPLENKPENPVKETVPIQEKKKIAPKKAPKKSAKAAKPKISQTIAATNQKNTVQEVPQQEETSKKVSTEDVSEEISEEEESSQDEETIEEDKETVSSIAGLDLSAREKFNIQSQLKMCYNRAVNETELESNIKIAVKVQISQDGYISSNLDAIIDEGRYNNPQETEYKIAIDNARRAMDLCSPLRNLPLDKYDIWKEVMLEFGGTQ